ncbi:MAG: hypothetical protein LC135_00925 [Phycisphaerae bacterium]|nr:hypothetical protein [Phycisphaerae bacterium]MCZ2398414.1 hypothetical protein [Phycisphaerae bacterium]
MTQPRLKSELRGALGLFGDASPFGGCFRHLVRAVRSTGLPHVFVGSVAVHLYGVGSHALDFHLCAASAERAKAKALVEHAGFVASPGKAWTVYDPATQLEAHFLASGEPAGDRFRYPEIRLPDPAEAVEREGVPVPTLERLLELCLVTGRLQDLAYAARLIRANGLDAAFAARLAPATRGAYLDCIARRIEEDETDPPRRDA